MIWGGLQKTSTIDFPGVLSCVLFARGCDLDCFYCHNRELLAREVPAIPEAEILAFLQKRRGLLDGVVISGGEAALWPDLPDFLRRIRAMGYQIKLDTNGQRPEVLESLARSGLLDYCAVDVKALPEDYGAVCGGVFQAVQNTLKVLEKLGISCEARTTLYPGLTLEQLETLLGLLPPQPRWRLNGFRMPEQSRPCDGERLARPVMSLAELRAVESRLYALQPNLIL